MKQLPQKQILNDTITGADLHDGIGVFDETKNYTSGYIQFWQFKLYKTKIAVAGGTEGDLSNAPDVSANWDLFKDRSFQFSVARNSSNVNSSQDLRRQNGTTTNNSPYIIAFPCELTAISAGSRQGTNETWTAEIYKNGSSVASLAISNTDKAYSDSYSGINFVAGDEIRMRFTLGSSGAVAYPGITAWFKEI